MQYRFLLSISEYQLFRNYVNTYVRDLKRQSGNSQWQHRNDVTAAKLAVAKRIQKNMPKVRREAVA